MANNNFEVQQGLTVGNLSIYAGNGAVITSGPITVGDAGSIAGSLNVGGNFSTGPTTLRATLDVKSDALFESNVTLTGGITSTSISSGTLQITGGAGISADVVIGGNITQTGTAYMGIPVGTVAQRPGVSTAATGMIRYNSDLGQYEGYGANGGSTVWSTLNGLKSVSGNAFVIVERHAGAGDDVVRMYAGDNNTSTQVMWASTSNIKILPTTVSTTPYTGALQVNGGVGIGGDTNLAGNITVAGTSTFPTFASPFVSNNTVATTQFVQTLSSLGMSTVPLTGVTGGRYSFASVGTGCTLTYAASNGVIAHVSTIVHGGTGYYTGDLLTISNGNFDVIIRVTSSSGGSVTGVAILYGGSGYPNSGTGAATIAAQAVASTYSISGTLTSNATFVMPVGTYLTASNQWYIGNNTTNTGSNTYDVKFFLDNGIGGTIGNGVTCIQGTQNSRVTVIQTDGVTDIYTVTGQTYIAYEDVQDNGPGNSDVLVVNYDPPFYQLTDGLTIGTGAVYVNKTATPTLNVNGLGAFTITKGTNVPLLVGDIGGNNHEMLMTFNLGTQTWVLQNPIFGVTTSGIQYEDFDDYQYFTTDTPVGPGFLTEGSGNVMYPDGEPLYQGSSFNTATATGEADSYFSGNAILIIEDSVGIDGLTNSLSIWNLNEPVYGAVTGTRANLLVANTLMTTDQLFVEFSVPYQALIDGLTVGSGFQYVNQTPNPTVNVDGLGAYTLVKGVNDPLLPGDIGGANHEGLMTYNFGTQTWVLQNPIFGVGTTGIQYQDATGTSDALIINFPVPYQALIDGMTVGGGAQYVNQTTTPTLNVDGLGAFPITKGTMNPLLLGDIGGNNHEMLLTFNLGTQSWVLQNPIFGVGTTGIQYQDVDDYQYFQANVVHHGSGPNWGGFQQEYVYTDPNTGITYDIEGEIVYQSPDGTFANATAIGNFDSVSTIRGLANVIAIEDSVFTANGGSGFFGIWQVGQDIIGNTTGAKANLYAFQSTFTSDILEIEFAIPYKALLDGLTVGGGAVYPNQTSTPVLDVDGLGQFPLTKGTNQPLLPGDVGGNNHEMLLTFNLGTQTWVLQNPMYGIGGVGTMFSEDTGTLNNMVAVFNPPFQIAIEGCLINVRPAFQNTSGTVTLTVDGLGTKAVKRDGGWPLQPGDILANGNYYALLTYNNGDWILQNPFNVFTPNVMANSGATSHSTTSGALQVVGGAGITGNVYTAAIYTSSYNYSNGAPFLSATIANSAQITANISSGQNIGLSLVNTAVTPGTYGNATYVPTVTVGADGRVTGLSTTPATNVFPTLNTQGNTYLAAPVTITGVTSITNATNSTGVGSGALVVTGGVGVAQTMYVGGNFYVAGNLYAANTISQSTTTLSASSPLVNVGENYTYPYNFDIGMYSHITSGSGNVTQYTAFARNHTNNYWSFVSNIAAAPNGVTVNFSDPNIIYDTISAGGAVFSNTTASTSTSTGALVVNGGAGIAGNVRAGAIYTSSYNYANGSPFLSATIANSAAITANISSGQNIGLSLVSTGVTPGNYGSAASIPTIVVGADGRITSLTSNAVSSSLSLSGTIGTGSVSLLSGALNIVGTNGLYTTISGSTITISEPQNLASTGTPTFAAGTITGLLTTSTLSATTGSTLAGQTIFGGGVRVYVGAGPDGTDNYSDIRQNSSTGSLYISSKSGALYLNYDNGKSGVAFGNGQGSQVGYVDQNGNANFIGAITQNGSQVITAANQSSYAPTLTGGNASGTWPISISGVAAQAQASGLQGTTIASGVINSSLTSLGTLTGLTVSGTALFNGALNAASGITSSTILAGTFGNTASVYNGTINTAAQTNITSLGTLTGLTVSGTTTQSGAVNVTNTTSSTAYNNGALTVAGGVGIAGAVYTNSAINAGGLVIASQSGFQSATYSAGRNRIWSFANSDNYGLSYFQGSGGFNSGASDMIGMHFGTATAAGSPFSFVATGNFYASGDIYSAYSDTRLKTVLDPITNAVGLVSQIETFYYEPNATAIELGATPGRRVGVSAQSVQAVLPEAVGPSNLGSDYLTVQYERLVPLLIESIKQHEETIKDLQAQIDQLKAKG
jgi:hypothetical protein